MRKLFIHIGLPKTATSLVQKFLYENEKLLTQQNLRYVHTGLHKDLKCHHELIWKLGLHQGPSYVDKNIDQEKSKVLDQLANENRKYKERDLIISSELLTFVDSYDKLLPIMDLFADREIYFLVSLRKQDEFLESLYQQIVKDGSPETFNGWFAHAKHIANYENLIDKLLALVSKEHIKVNLFNSKKRDFHPIKDFLRALGFSSLELEQLHIENKFENESLSNEAIEMIRLSNQLGLDINYFLVEKLKQLSHTKARYLNEEQRAEIARYFNETNKNFIKKLSLNDKKWGQSFTF